MKKQRDQLKQYQKRINGVLGKKFHMSIQRGGGFLTSFMRFLSEFLPESGSSFWIKNKNGGTNINMINGNKSNIYQCVTANPPCLYGEIYLVTNILRIWPMNTRRKEQKRVKVQLVSIRKYPKKYFLINTSSLHILNNLKHILWSHCYMFAIQFFQNIWWDK